MKRRRKILISSAWHNPAHHYDIARWRKRSNLFSLSAPIQEHFGLRFLKANVPDVEILEYPTREVFLDRLSEGWDVVGISFYINETWDALAMVHAVRERLAAVVWGGNFGAFNPRISHYFDQVISGWGEEFLAEEYGYEISVLKHPLLFMKLNMQFGFPLQKWGVLFSSRGCSATCDFCQTPKFYGKSATVSLYEIERVLQAYQRMNVDQVIILDENFGAFLDHTEAIVDLLKFYGLRWHPLARVNTLYRHYSQWLKAGMVGVSVGVESLNSASLDGCKKGIDLSEITELLGKMKNDRVFVQVFYIIGFEHDSETSILRDIQNLKKFRVDAPQIQVLTPFPNTRRFSAIREKYGILSEDWSKYDGTHLVWRHPNISRERMRELLFWANQTLYHPGVSFQTLVKTIWGPKKFEPELHNKEFSALPAVS